MNNITVHNLFPDVCLFCSDIYIYIYTFICVCIYGYVYVRDALSKGHSMCARAKRNHHHHTSYPSGHKYKALSSFSLRNFVTLSLSFLDQTHALFSFHIYTYIHSYIRCVQEGSLSRTKIFFFPSLTPYTYVLEMEKK